MPPRLSRRQLMAVPAALALMPASARAGQAHSGGSWSLPIRNEGDVPGDGFYIRYGYASENTRRHPGWWHAAEDWHRDADVDTAGAEVLAVHAGEVVYAGSDYPGRVILVRHAGDLYSMYGHLDLGITVDEGDEVAAGQVLGRVVAAEDWESDNHLHFEIRGFLFNAIVNGDQPQHGVHCGYQCPPGPGYWPITAPEHPGELGWRNPTHVIERGLAAIDAPLVAQVARGAEGRVVAVRQDPDANGLVLDEREVRAGERFPIVAIDAGDPASLATSAGGYRVWYLLEVESGTFGWVSAMVADDTCTGLDGRPSSVRPLLLPVIG